MIRLVIGDRRSLRKGVPNDEEPRPSCLDIAVGTKPLLALRPVHPIHDATVGSIEQILFIVRRGAPPQTGIEHDRAHASRRRFGEWNPVAQHMNSSNGKFAEGETEERGKKDADTPSCYDDTPV